jgi:hypothetical protein
MLRWKVSMADEQIPPDSPLRDAPPTGDGQASLAEAARDDAEQVRRRAEEDRELRDKQREEAEELRRVQERLRDAAEKARAGNEAARVIAEEARDQVVNSVRATAEILKTTLEQMGQVEELRRMLREVRDPNKLDSN